MTETVLNESTRDARYRIAFAAGVGLLVAGLLLVTIVLPAEFAVDPIGVGAKIGLLDLGTVGKQIASMESSAGTGAATDVLLVPSEKPFSRDTVAFVLEPGGSIEYKYRLDKGEALLFSWQATAPVGYEFHAEPDEGPRGYAQTYEKSSGSGTSGTLTAPFTGIHGWYWENPTDRAVTVTLSSAGFYNLSHEFGSDGSVRNKSFPITSD